MDRSEWDDVLESFELADDESTVRPWTGVRDVELVPAFFGWVLSSWFGGDEVPERGGLSFEVAFWGGPVKDALFFLVGLGGDVSFGTNKC